MFQSSFTFSALAQCFSTISEAAHPEHNPHGSALDAYTSPTSAMTGTSGMSLPTTYAGDQQFAEPYGR